MFEINIWIDQRWMSNVEDGTGDGSRRDLHGTRHHWFLRNLSHHLRRRCLRSLHAPADPLVISPFLFFYFFISLFCFKFSPLGAFCLCSTVQDMSVEFDSMHSEYKQLVIHFIFSTVQDNSDLAPDMTLTRPRL